MKFKKDIYFGVYFGTCLDCWCNNGICRNKFRCYCRHF